MKVSHSFHATVGLSILAQTC